MVTLAYYLLKVIICSGVLYIYYHLALRNKIFHHWNRFYLLMAVVLSVVLPLIKINVFGSGSTKTPIIHMIQLVTTSDEFIYNYNRNGFAHITLSTVSLLLYTLVSAFLLFIIVQTFARIEKLKNKYPATIIEGVNFRNTNAKGTPFSFFNNIFWNDEIDIHSKTGHQIFQHEIAHVHEKHSHDKIFISLLLIVFWCNPFFWLIRKELNMIHEFIADKKALEDMDTATFAAMILKTTYPQQKFTITNNFFYSPLKRRLNMITNNKNPKISYIGRLLVLPLMAFLFFAFTLKMKKRSDDYMYSGKTITVVIDAGHGGTDRGAISENGINEKDINLQIANKIKELNVNRNINVVLSRTEDKMLTPFERVNFTRSVHADLFISIHMDAGAIKNEHSGLTVFIQSDTSSFVNQSRLLGSAILESFKPNYPLPIEGSLYQRQKGIWVLKANDRPSILIEAGFLTTQKDVDFLTNKANQELIARNILKGIENYEQADKSTASTPNPTTDSMPRSTFNTQGEPLIIVDGVEKGPYKKVISSIDPQTIEAINVLKDESAIKKYGDKGRYGVIEIITKKKGNKEVATNKLKDEDIAKVKLYQVIQDSPANSKQANPDPANPQIVAIRVNGETTKLNYSSRYDKIFSRVENTAQFPGGDVAWGKYIKKMLEQNMDALTKSNNTGTCLVRFIVGLDGSVSDVEALTLKDTKLAEVVVDAIKKGPKWNAAKQNDIAVTSYREVPVTFTMTAN